MLADETPVRAVTSSLVVLDCLQQQIKTLEQTVHKRLYHTPSYEPLLTVPGIGTILAQTIALETGAISRFPTVGNSASYCRCVDSTKLSNGKRTGTGNVKNGTPYLAWASMEAAPCALRFQPAAQRFSQRTLAKSRHKTIWARKAVAHTRSRACSDMMRDLVPCEATQAFGCGLASHGVEAGGWGKSGGTSTRSDSSRSQPIPHGLPPHSCVVRRLCRALWKRWTREGAIRAGRWTCLDTAGHRGFSGASTMPGGDVWRSSETSRGLDPAG